MDDAGPLASIFIFVLFIMLEALIYGFGAAIQNLNVKEEERRAQEEGNKKAAKLCRIIRHSESYVNMVQFIVTLIHLMIGGYYLKVWVAAVRHTAQNLAAEQWNLTPFAGALLAGISFVLTVILLLYVMLVFGMLVPKKAAARNPEAWAYRLVGPVWGLLSLFAPLTALLSMAAGAILRLLGLHSEAETNDVTEEEILSMVNEGHEQGVIEASEAKMISNIFEFGDKEAQDIMTNRRDMIGVDNSLSFGEAVQFMLHEKNSRFPVYEENIDHIVGILHMKDALRMQSRIPPEKPLCEIEGLIRSARFIPETRKIDALFRTMKNMKLQMVIVVDEYGQTSGLVAMEDILEEIVGNIQDEYDEDEEHIEKMSQNEYIIEGKTRLEDLEELFGISFCEEEFETLNGFLISRMQHIPEPDEQFSVAVDGYEFQILSIQNKMVQSVLVTRLQPPEKTAEQEDAPACRPFGIQETARILPM